MSTTITNFFAPFVGLISLLKPTEAPLPSIVPSGPCEITAECGDPRNTDYAGNLLVSEMDTTGALHNHLVLDRVDVERTLPTKTGLDEVRVENGELIGFFGGAVYRGDDFLDAEFQVHLSGAPLILRVTDVNLPNNSVPTYQITYREPGEEEQNLCGDSNVEVVVHADLQIDLDTGNVAKRPNTIYFACSTGAAGKVARADLGWGYPPHEIGFDKFELMLRLVRADYCYDGTSWTSPGQPLILGDKLGVYPGDPTSLQAPQQNLEAIWGPGGVVCLTEYLRHDMTYRDIDCGDAPVPPPCPNDLSQLWGDVNSMAWTALPGRHELPLATP